MKQQGCRVDRDVHLAGHLLFTCTSAVRESIGRVVGRVKSWCGSKVTRGSSVGRELRTLLQFSASFRFTGCHDDVTRRSLVGLAPLAARPRVTATSSGDCSGLEPWCRRAVTSCSAPAAGCGVVEPSTSRQRSRKPRYRPSCWLSDDWLRAHAADTVKQRSFYLPVRYI